MGLKDKIFGSKEKEKDEQYMEDAAHIAQQRVMTEDYVNSLGRTYFMLEDENVTSMLQKDPQLRTLLPAFSRVNRTTKIGKRDAKLLMIDYNILTLLHEINMDEDTFEAGGWAKLEALKIFAHALICDQFEGWKGRLVTETISIIKTEIERKKKGLLG